MKKLLIVLLVLPFFAFVAADWVAVKLDERVTVSFAAMPEIKDVAGNSVWVQDIDKGARCMVMVVDFEKFGSDSAGIAAEMAKEEAFVEFRKAVLGQIEGGTLIAETKSAISGKTYFEYVIDLGKGGQPDVLNVLHSRNIFVGAKMYTLSFYEKNGLPREVERDKFFSSFKLSY
jgi:hypothetical protein